MSSEPDSYPGQVELMGQPSVGWVVHEVTHSKEAQPTVWAWCRVAIDGPGYQEITFTKPDGTTAVDAPKDLVLGRVLFQLWC